MDVEFAAELNKSSSTDEVEIEEMETSDKDNEEDDVMDISDDQFDDDDDDEYSGTSSESSSNLDSDLEASGRYNLVSLKNTAAECERYLINDRLAAALANAIAKTLRY